MGKPKRMLKYLKGTRGFELTLSVDDMSIIKWWVDTSCATYEGCEGHTGSMITMGKGAITSSSCNQKIQGESSAEDELIGVNDTLPQALWTKYCIDGQGYKVDQHEIHQDNKSAQSLEENSCFSSSK